MHTASLSLLIAAVQAYVNQRGPKLTADLSNWQGQDLGGATAEPGFVRDDSVQVMRRGGDMGETQRLWRVGWGAALLCACGILWLASQTFMLKAKTAQTDASNVAGLYPWLSLPPVTFEELLDIGSTYASDEPEQALESRGMKRAKPGKLALVALSSSLALDPGSNIRALLERNMKLPGGGLGMSRQLVQQLLHFGLQDLTPLSFRYAQLRQALRNPDENVSNLLEVPAPCWYLKHSCLDTGGLHCFQDLAECFKFWRTVPPSTRYRFVAQAEVQRRLFLGDQKMTVRAWVVSLSGGRSFLHRELLLFGEEDRQLAEGDKQHSVCLRGTSWEHCHEVWSKIREMLETFLGAVAQRTAEPAQGDKDQVEPQGFWETLLEGRLPDWLGRWFGQSETKAAGALQYNLLTADFTVDEDLRPWLVAMNPGVELRCAPDDDVEDDDGLRAEILEDALTLFLDPLLNFLPPGKVGKTGRKKNGKHRFIELSRVTSKPSPRQR